MKAIVEQTAEETAKYREMYIQLRTAVHGMTSDNMFEGLKRQYGYAHYKFSGKVSAALIERLGRMPTSDEIIILVDRGYSNFGAVCEVSPTGTFTGRIYTD